MPRWSFITNHGTVLACIAEYRQITAREIAVASGITERSVHRIIADLEAAGYLDKSRAGRVTRYEVNEGLPLPGAERRSAVVGDLLRVLLGDRVQKDLTPSGKR